MIGTRTLLVVLALGCAATAYAQPGCRSQILPAPPPEAWGHPTDKLGAEDYMASPSNETEFFGHLDYPLTYYYPKTATAVGLMYFTARVPTWKGETVTKWHVWDPTRTSYEPERLYVWADRIADGWAGPIEWQDAGILFEGYHLLDLELGPNGEEPTWGFRATQHFGQAYSASLSIVLQPGEGWQAAVNSIRYPGYRVLTQLQLHVRECYLPGQEPTGR